MPNTFLWVILVVEVGVAVLWGIATLAARTGPIADRLTQPARPDASSGATAPSLAVYIAAHNEEATIESCLERLLAQDIGRLSVTVVSDRSTDATSARVRSVMARDARVRLVEISDLPPGWIGKTHALAVATEQADGDYLLFLDSDCRLLPGALAAVMDRAVADDLEFVSLLPRLVLASPWERILTPPVAWLLGLWAMIDGVLGVRPAESPVGNGQFMLFQREAYHRLGGHASVRAELVEDAVLARRAAGLGLRSWSGSGVGLYESSRSNGLRSALNASARILIGTLASRWRLLASKHLLLGGCLLPFWVGPVGVWVALTRDPVLGGLLVAASGLHVVVMTLALWGMFAEVFTDRRCLVYFPLGALACVAVTVWSFLIMTGRGTVRWGTSRYRVRGSQIQTQV